MFLILFVLQDELLLCMQQKLDDLCERVYQNPTTDEDFDCCFDDFHSFGISTKTALASFDMNLSDGKKVSNVKQGFIFRNSLIVNLFIMSDLFSRMFLRMNIAGMKNSKPFNQPILQSKKNDECLIYPISYQVQHLLSIFRF